MDTAGDFHRLRWRPRRLRGSGGGRGGALERELRVLSGAAVVALARAGGAAGGGVGRKGGGGGRGLPRGALFFFFFPDPVAVQKYKVRTKRRGPSAM